MRVFNVKTGKTLEDELPSGTLFQRELYAGRRPACYYARTNEQGTLLYQHVLGTRVSQDKLIFGHEFRGEDAGAARSGSRRA